MTMQHIGGVWWFDAPLPPRRHSCFTHSGGWAGFERIHRCACGAISRDGKYWMSRNSRRAQASPKSWWRRLVARFGGADR